MGEFAPDFDLSRFESIEATAASNSKTERHR